LALGFHQKLNKNIVFQDIVLKDRHITYAYVTKRLGLWLNHNFNWDLHAENSLKS